MSDNTSGTTPTDPAGSPELVDRRGARRRLWLIGGGAVVAVAAIVTAVLVVTGGDDDASAETTDPDDAAATETTEATETAEPAAGPTTLTVGLTLEPTNLDIRSTSGIALDQVLIDNVYEGLLHREADGTVAPGLAADWTVSDDALSYTFTLHPGITFSNGHELTAEDVVWSVQQVVDGELSGSDQLTAVAEVTAVDEVTVQIALTQPDPNLPWALSGRPGLVLDSEEANDLKTSAVGSGPFLLQEWKQGDSLVLVRNETYWGAEPAGVDTVVFRYIPEQAAAVNALESGDLDVLAPIDALRVEAVARADLDFVEGAASDKFVLAFNNSAAPLDDLRVRQAIRHAIDHEALVEARGGVDHVLGGPIPEGDPGYEDLTDLYPYDVDQATALLAEAGYPDGLDLTLTIPSFYGSTFPDLLTSQLAEAGIRLTVDSVEFSAWLSDVYTNADYELSIVDHAETRDFANWANPEYYFRYDNADVQDLFAQAQVATGEEAAAALLAEAARIVSQEAAADWLTNFRTVTAVSTAVHGFPTDNINARLDVTGVTVDAS